METSALESESAVVAEWAEGLRWPDVPGDVVAKARLCLQDFLACAVGGSTTAAGRALADAALSWGGPPQACIVGGSGRVPARHAALVNGTAANALDYDDTFRGHPGSSTFAATMALGEKWDCLSRDVLLASIVGYEVAARCMVLMRPLVPRFEQVWDLGALQAQGAAAAGAKLAGLDADRIRAVMGVTSGTAPVPLPRKGGGHGGGRSMLKSARGWAAEAAVTATELVVAGFDGPRHSLDDNLGFWTVDQSRPYGLRSLSDGLGTVWLIREVELKPYMSCRFLHPALECVAEIMGRDGVDAEMIDRIEVATVGLLCDAYHSALEPSSSTDAQFSLPYTVSTLVRGGRLTTASYTATELVDVGRIELSRKVSIERAEEFDRRFPERLGARVRIFFGDGRSHEAEVDDALGSPRRPLDAERLRDKWADLMDPVLGEAARTAALQLAGDGGRTPVRHLGDLLVRLTAS